MAFSTTVLMFSSNREIKGAKTLAQFLHVFFFLILCEQGVMGAKIVFIMDKLCLTKAVPPPRTFNLVGFCLIGLGCRRQTKVNRFIK